MNERQKIKLTRAINAASHLRPAIPALIPNFQNLQPDGALAVLTEDLNAMPHDSDPWDSDFAGLPSAAATLYLPSYDNDTGKVRWGEASDELKNIQVHNLTGEKYFDGDALWISQQYGAWLVRGPVFPHAIHFCKPVSNISKGAAGDVTLYEYDGATETAGQTVNAKALMAAVVGGGSAKWCTAVWIGRWYVLPGEC